MNIDFTSKLKFFLTSVVMHDGDTEAWEHLKLMDLSSEELNKLIRYSNFSDEAWELYKQHSPTNKEVINIMHWLESTDKVTTLLTNKIIAFLMEQSHLDNETLSSLINYANSTDRDEAAKRLLKQNPNNDQLESIISGTNLKNEAGLRLLKQSPDNWHLYSIITYTKYKKEAWAIFLQQSPTDDELIEFIEKTSIKGDNISLEEIGWQELMKRKPTNETLMDLLDFFWQYEKLDDVIATTEKEKLARLILKRSPSNKDLITIFNKGLFEEEAWALLLQQSLDCDDLDTFIWNGNTKRNEAAELSLKMNPTQDQLWDIFNYSDKKKEALEQLDKKKLDFNKLIKIILTTSDPETIDILCERVHFDRTKVNETELVQSIAKKIMDNPELLTVNNWHTKDSHCFAGWAINQVEAAKVVEKQYSPEIAACVLLPNHPHLFYEDKETILSELNKILSVS